MPTSISAHRSARSRLRTHKRGQFSERLDFMIGMTWKAFRALGVAIAPDHAHPEGRSCIGVPRIRRQKRDRTCFDTQMVDSKLIDPWIRFVYPDILDR